jgi:nucleoside diphosphate kinase
MKITEYDKGENANTINIIFGVGVRSREIGEINQFLENKGFHLSGSRTVDCTNESKHTIHNYMLKG